MKGYCVLVWVCQLLKAGHSTELLTQCWPSWYIYPGYLKNFKAHPHCDLGFLKKKSVINLWQSSDTFWDLLEKILERPQDTGENTWTKRSQGSFIRYQHELRKSLMSLTVSTIIFTRSIHCENIYNEVLT